MTKPLTLRAIRNFVCASACALALNSCATGPAPVLTAEDLLSTPYMAADGAPFDVDAIFAALPDWLDVSHGGARFDPALGGMVIDDLTFAFASVPDARLVADRAVMWGGDPAAAQAVFSGAASLTDMSALFDRLIIEGLHSEGLQWEQGSESASLSLGKVVIDGLSARSYALAEKPGAEEAGVLRHIAAAMGSFAYEGAAYADFSFRTSNSRGDNVVLTLDQAFARGYDAGALDYQSARGMRAMIESGDAAPLVEVAGEAQKKPQTENPYAKILNTPSADAAENLMRHPAAFMAQAAMGGVTDYKVDFSETRGMDVSGGLYWLARWELPPITETELLDFGAQTMTGYVESWNGETLYSVERAEVAASDFYWLVPSHYDVAYQGLAYDFNVMLAQMRDGMGAGFATEAAPQFQKIFEVVSALGMERVTGDAGLSWLWDGESGDAMLTFDGDAADLAAMSYGVNAAGPSLARWEEMARNDTRLTVASQEIALETFSYTLTDKGLLARSFDYAAEQQSRGGAEVTGADMRQSVVGMLRLSGAQSGEMNARFPAYAKAVADFLEQGGTISLLAAPPAPVTLMKLQMISQSAPQTLPDALNLTVTHTDE